MSLNDPSFIKFDGSPDLGRVPVRLTVDGGVALTASQMAGVEHAYYKFRSACRLSISEFHTELVELSDSTVVWLWSLQGRDEVTVWPPAVNSKAMLPHGFLVLSDYSDPGFFCRGLDGAWSFVPLFIPQAQDLPIHGTNQIAYYLTSETLIAHPSVLTPGQVWDFARHDVTSQVGWTPIVTKDINGEREHIPHLAKENTIKKADGVTVFTMADDVPWWAYIELADWYKDPRGDNYFRPVYVKPVTDTAGTVCLMNGFRLHTTLLQYELHSVQSQSVALKLEDGATYTPTYTNNVFNPPLLGATTPIEETYTSDLDGELPATDFSLRGINLSDNLGSGWYPYVCCPATSYAAAGGYFDWNYLEPKWYVPRSRTLTHAGPVSFTAGEPVFASSYTQRFEYVHGPEVVIHDVAMVPVSTGYVKARLINRISYPSSLFMRGGYVTVMAENKSGAWDYYGVEGRRIDRRDSQLSMNAEPWLELDLGDDMRIKLFEGTATASVSGHWYRDWDYYLKSATVRDWDSHGQVIVYPHNGVSPPPIATAAGQSTFIGAGYQAIFEGAMWSREDIDAVSWGDASRIGATSPYDKTRDEFEPPENTAAYHYKSRYIIDCDTRAKFVVSLLVEVISTGAKWVQSTAQWAVVGDLAVDTHPTCTVNIYAECVYNGGPAVTKLLLTGGFTRWSMEYKTSPSRNPYQEGANGAPALYITTPPEVSPSLWFYRQLQNLSTCQSGNQHLAAQDIIPNQPEASISPTGLDWTDSSIEEPLTKLATGVAYTRVIRLSDFWDAMWLLRDLKIDADETGNYVEGMPRWHFLPEFGAKYESEYHVISILDGEFQDWTTVIPPKDGVPVPDPKDRNIKLYRI